MILREFMYGSNGRIKTRDNLITVEIGQADLWLTTRETQILAKIIVYILKSSHLEIQGSLAQIRLRSMDFSGRRSPKYSSPDGPFEP